MDSNDAFLPLFITEPIYTVEPFNETDYRQVIEEKSVLPEVEEASATRYEDTSLVIRGENKSNILVLIDENTPDFMMPASESLLKKILLSIKLQPEDIKLVNVHKRGILQTPLLQLLENTPFKLLISFGAVVPEWPISGFFTKYVVSRDNMNRKILLSDDLTQLASDENKKKALWSCLKDIHS